MNCFFEVLKVDLLSKFGSDQFKFLTTPVGDQVIEAPKEVTHALLQYLKEYARFDFLMDVCGVDYPNRAKRFDVVYHLFNSTDYSRLRVKTQVAENESVMTATNIWIGADWFEREAYDMFGINFLNHPDLRRMYMMEEFEYYPLRKDYPLMGLPGAIQLPKK